jgi:hypothetical protein
MSSPFVIQPSAAPTYDFVTNQSYGTLVKIPTRVNLSGAVLEMRVDDNSKFLDSYPIGSVDFVNSTVEVSLSREEVDKIKDGFYQITAYRNGTAYLLVEGQINYERIASTDSNLLDVTGKIRIELLPPLVDIFGEVFLRKDEYIAGEGANPAIIEEVVQVVVDRHVNNVNPHPAYDDMPSLRLLFENGLI